MPTLNATEVALLYLEASLDDEPTCQSKTRHDPSEWYYVPCSHSVTHYVKACDGFAALICQNATDSIREAVTLGVICRYCDRPASECWRIVAV